MGFGTFESEAIIEKLIKDGVKPDKELVAEAGRNYSYIAAWKYEGEYLIKHVHEGYTYYNFSEDIKDIDLIKWMEWGVDDSVEYALRIAHIRGADAVPEAEEGEPYVWVLITRNFRDSTKSHNFARDSYSDNDDDDWKDWKSQVTWFKTYAEAQAWIDGKKADYKPTPNEVGREYKIVSASLINDMFDDYCNDLDVDIDSEFIYLSPPA